MRIVTWNVNGIRAISGKGFLDWFSKSKADVVCLQEIKATLDKIPAELKSLKGWNATFLPAKKPGYSGVALFSRQKPDEIWMGLGDKRFDDEGRVLGARFGDLHVISAYFPNSQPEGKRLDLKVDFCTDITKKLSGLAKKKQEIVLTGDYNIAHERIDLARPDDNSENPGFFPRERQAMSDFLKAGFVDIFRERNPDRAGLYTWWSYRAAARERNVGWRIDYTCITPGLRSRVKDAWIEPLVMGSDHCPVGLDLK
ncbi:MAG TPA: exodeoxyribonuclease III [bacterium]|nr:exodeoxyribonuclease III [bacterium]